MMIIERNLGILLTFKYGRFIVMKLLTESVQAFWITFNEKWLKIINFSNVKRPLL